MQNYRLYRLDGAGKIKTAEWVEADHDEDALEKARDRCATDEYEVWDRKRLVGRNGGAGPVPS